jgi:hypothetical protein
MHPLVWRRSVAISLRISKSHSLNPYARILSSQARERQAKRASAREGRAPSQPRTGASKWSISTFAMLRL